MMRAQSDNIKEAKRKVSANRKRFPNIQSITSSIQNLLNQPSSSKATTHKHSHSKILAKDLVSHPNEWNFDIPKSAHQ